MSKQKLGKKLNFNILESTTKRTVEKYKSRKVENQKSREVEKQSNWKTGKRKFLYGSRRSWFGLSNFKQRKKIKNYQM